MKETLKQRIEKLENGRYAALVQFIKFGLVGVSNTAISYGIEMLCYYALFAERSFAGAAGWLSGLGIQASGETIKIILTTALAFIVSVTHSYYWNNRFVFAAGTKKTFRQHLISYCKTVLCYSITGLLLSPAIKVWLSGLGVPYWLAALGSLAVTIPLNFVLNKYWAFKRRKA